MLHWGAGGGESNPEAIEVGPPFLLETLEKTLHSMNYLLHNLIGEGCVGLHVCLEGTKQETHSMLPQTEPLETKPVKVTMIKLNICQGLC